MKAILDQLLVTELRDFCEDRARDGGFLQHPKWVLLCI